MPDTKTWQSSWLDSSVLNQLGEAWKQLPRGQTTKTEWISFIAQTLKNFRSFQICPYARYENSEIFPTWFFCSESVGRSVKTVAKKASHYNWVNFFRNWSFKEISEFSNLHICRIRKLGNFPNFTLLFWTSWEKRENSFLEGKPLKLSDLFS